MIWQFFYDYYTMMLESSWFLQHIQFFHPTVLNDFPVNLFYLGIVVVRWMKGGAQDTHAPAKT